MIDSERNHLNKNKVYFSTSMEEKKNNNIFKVKRFKKLDNSLLKKNISRKEISKEKSNLTNMKIIKEKIGKSIPWTEEDDKLLLLSAKENNEKNWKRVASSFKGRTSIQCSSRYHRIKPGLNKGHFTKEEDLKLISLYKIYGKKWNLIAKGMKNRTGKQVRDRYLNSLAPGVNKKKFSTEEDTKILKYYKIYGNSWSTIAKFINGRTGDMIKNRYYSYLKKYFEKENIFKDYIEEEKVKNGENKNNPIIVGQKNNLLINLNIFNFQINNMTNQEYSYSNNNNISFMNNYLMNSNNPFFPNLLFSNLLKKGNKICSNDYLDVNINFQNIINSNGILNNIGLNNNINYYNCNNDMNYKNKILSQYIGKKVQK